MADAKTREASLITFVAAAANITLFGIGGAFWGLVIGLVTYAVLNGRPPQRAQASQTALQTTPEPIVVKGAAN